MRILTVIPIVRGISKQTLTYFSKNNIDIGKVIPIPLKKKTVHGLVTESRPVTEAKSEIKSLPFSLKGAKNTEGKSFLREEFLRACEKISDFYATTGGAVLSQLIPKVILGNPPITKKQEAKSSFHEVLLLQSDEDERYATYRSLIREEFAKNRSVLFLLPTTEDVLTAQGLLDKGIESYTCTLHGNMKKKDILETWEKIISESHSIVIITTGSFLSLPRSDIGTIIVERESSRAYKTLARPFLDIRTVAEIFAKEISARLIFGDTLLRVETIWREKNGQLAELAPLKFRSLSSASTEIIGMREPADMKKKEFHIFSYQIRDMLRQARDNNEHSFLFCGRKGLFPNTVCADCGTIVICGNCQAPMVLYGNLLFKKTAKGNMFVCHHCSERRDAHELCRHCKGWRLIPLGIGIENVRQKVLELLPNAPVMILDKDHVKTHVQAIRLRDKFYDMPGGICLGTEMAMSYLREKVENVGIVSIDSYFSVPDFRVSEKVFHVIIMLRAMAAKCLILQTRQEKILFNQALNGNLIDFYRNEIEDRKLMNFPPFGFYIKITMEGEKSKVKTEMEKISEHLKPYAVNIYEAFNPGSKTKHVIHGLISIDKENWPDKELLKKLHALPAYVMVKVDPDTLL